MPFCCLIHRVVRRKKVDAILFTFKFVYVKHAEWILCFKKEGLLFELLLVVCLIESCFIFSCRIYQWNAFHLGMFHYMQYPIAFFSSITHLQITLFPSDGFWKDLLQNRYFLSKFYSFAVYCIYLFTEWQFCCCSCCFSFFEGGNDWARSWLSEAATKCSSQGLFNFFFVWTDIFTSVLIWFCFFHHNNDDWLHCSYGSLAKPNLYHNKHLMTSKHWKSGLNWNRLHHPKTVF